MNEPVGNAAILVAGAMWAVALTQFQKGGKGMTGPEVNLAKNLVGFAAFALAALLLEGWRVGADLLALLALTGAGVLGMGWGDSLFLGAMRILGVGRTTVLVLTLPLITLAAETAILGWRPPASQIGGIILLLAGVALAVGRRRTKAEWQGVRMVLLASLLFSAGLLLTRWGFDRAGDSVGLLTSTMLRVGGGVLWLLVVGRLRP
ncbi:EamA family transporter, partial [bacterium]|nr:EamA family transporter [bacterium]